MSLIIFSILSALASIFLRTNPPLPFTLTPDMAAKEEFVKRENVMQKDQANFLYYSDEAKKIIENVKESDLLGLRCTDSFIRTNQGAYILEHVKTDSLEKKRIKNFEFTEYMRNKEPGLPAGKKILSARICESEDKTLLMIYSIGKYNTNDTDALAPTQVILSSTENTVLIQIISKSSQLNSSEKIFRESKNHLRCERVFQMTKNGIIYLLCEEKEDYLSTFDVYRIDLKTGRSELLKTCVNKFENEIEAVCD